MAMTVVPDSAKKPAYTPPIEPVPMTATTGCAGSMIFSLITKWTDKKIRIIM
jgi:hypothetical protein